MDAHEHHNITEIETTVPFDPIIYIHVSQFCDPSLVQLLIRAWIDELADVSMGHLISYRHGSGTIKVIHRMGSLHQ